MMLAGDEFARSQGGNNNAYGQDSEIGWVDWDVPEPGRRLGGFVQKLIALRRALPMLRRGRFLTGTYDEELGSKDVTWLTPDGEEMTDENWTDGNARCVGVLLDGRAQPTGIRRPGTDATLYLVFNAHHDVVNCTLPEAPGGAEWVLLVDTNQPELETLPRFPFGHSYGATGRSLLLFMTRPAAHRAGGTEEAQRSYLHVVAAFEQALDEELPWPEGEPQS
jgi:glycogen operon protein